jgi:hypothetical protein
VKVYRGLESWGSNRSRVSSSGSSLCSITCATLTGSSVLQSLESVGAIGFGFESKVPIKDAVIFETRALEEVAEYSLQISAARRSASKKKEADEKSGGPVVWAILEA